MKLTYRGIDYKSRTKDKQNLKFLPTSVDKCGASRKNLDRLISIEPVYYTYRGVSYIKNLVSDTHKKILPDINRQ